MLAFDLETQLIRPALQAPPPVCLSQALPGALAPTPEAREVFRGLITAGVPIVGHNVTYDLACILAWWGLEHEICAALDAGLVYDTGVIERIAEIGRLTSRKELSLKALCRVHGLVNLDKDEVLRLEDVPTCALHLYDQAAPPEVRLSYSGLLDRPLSWYAPQQIGYAVADSVATLALFERQHERWIAPGYVRHADVSFLVAKNLWLELCRAWGIRIDPTRLNELRSATELHLAELTSAARELGVLRENGQKNMRVLRELVREAYDGTPPMTDEKPRAGAVRERKNAARQARGEAPKHFVPQIRTSRAVLEESGDERLITIAKLGEWQAVQNMVLPAFESGTLWPIHTKWGMADTTRTTSSAPNIQNVRKAVGVRECFVPRSGRCFVSIDHSGLENATLAQFIVTHLGRRALADFINADGDLHCLVASRVAGISYEEAVRLHAAEDPDFANVRNSVKPINFGGPGGAGWKTLKFIAKQGYHLDWSEEDTRRYLDCWKQAVPDIPAYHAWVSSQPTDDEDRIQVLIPGTTIMRRGCTFCSACNNGFQALGAVIEAWVGWQLLKERLLTDSPLAQCAMVNYVHDEFIFEVPLGLQTRVAERLEWHMTHDPARFLPDVKIKAEAKAMAAWSKKARRVVREGELCVWAP